MGAFISKSKNDSDQKSVASLADSNEYKEQNKQDIFKIDIEDHHNTTGNVTFTEEMQDPNMQEMYNQIVNLEPMLNPTLPEIALRQNVGDIEISSNMSNVSRTESYFSNSKPAHLEESLDDVSTLNGWCTDVEVDQIDFDLPKMDLVAIISNIFHLHH